MKSILRMNGQELVVEGVIPVSDEFNKAVFDEIQKVTPGLVEMEPTAPFGVPEDRVEGYISHTLWGKFDGEVPFNIKVVNGDAVSHFTAFICFRK